MSEEAFAAAIIELEQSPDSAPAIPGISGRDAEAFKDAVDSMYSVRAYAEVPLEEFVSDVCESLTDEDELPPKEQPPFRHRLLRVLSIDSLNVASKAGLLQNEFERDFCEARILTDVRPIFGEDVNTPPAAMIISHTLKISFHEGGGRRVNEVYFCMGSRDIAQLRSVLDRAEAKAKSIRAALKPTKLRLIDPQQ
jgi:hypothetical protein